jgi:repressor LexA
MSIGSNIRKLRLLNHMTQEELGKVADVSAMAVSQWENDRAIPRMRAVNSMANYFDVTIADIIDVYIPDYTEGSYIDVPLLGSIAAGDPIEMDAVENTHPIPVSIHKKYPDAFLLLVKGESMNRILPNGSYALINPCSVVEHQGKPYAICVNGYDATIKRVKKLANGFELIPDSTDPTYEAKVYNYNEPGTETVTVIGEVVYHVLPFDWTY